MKESMAKGRIIIVTGAPGTGKSTVSELLAMTSEYPVSLHMHTDDFYHYLKKGYIAPHLPESDKQNRTVIGAILAAAMHFADNGYDVIVDGIIGPWFLPQWEEAARKGYEIHYIVLRAGKATTMERAISRSKLDRKTNMELVKAMWEQFSDLGAYDRYAVDAEGASAEKTMEAVRSAIGSGAYRL